jgi:hypothetical protein
VESLLDTTAITMLRLAPQQFGAVVARCNDAALGRQLAKTSRRPKPVAHGAAMAVNKSCPTLLRRIST